MQKIIRLGKEAEESLSKGVDIVADAVKLTLGPDGCNAVLGHQYQPPESTNDGMSIAMECHSDDEIEQLAVEQMQIIAKEIYRKSGDGTTTGITLGQAIKNAGLKALNTNDSFIKIVKSPMKLMNDIFAARDVVLQELDAMAKPIKTNDEVRDVAFVSVENLEHAQMIADMYDIVGKDGVITIEDGYNGIEHEITDGLEIEAGYPYDNFSNNNKSYITENALFLVTNQRIEYKEQLQNISTILYSNGINNLILIADDITNEMNEEFLRSKLTRSFVIIPVKAPYFGKREKMKDIAVALGATFFDKEDMKLVSQATIDDLGKSNKVTITEDKTIILKPAGNTEEYVARLKEELKKTTDRFDKEQLTKRIAKLSGGIGVIRVGGDDSTRTYFKKKLQNAVNAAKYALQGGVVPGGGLALKAISEKLPVNILTDALLSPYRQLVENSGGSLIVGDDIVDPVITEKAAVEFACSVAGIVITQKIAIADKYEKPKDYQLEE